MTVVTSYTIDVKYRFDQKSVAQVDAAMRKLEAKIKAMSNRLKTTLAIDVSRFTIDQRKLNTSLGSALSVASASLPFSINRFEVDQSRLNRSMRNAFRQAASSTTFNPTINVRGNGMGGQGIQGSHLFAGGAGGLVARAYMPALAVLGGGYGLAQLNRRNQEVVSSQLQTQAVIQQAGGTEEQGRESFQYLRSEANRIGFNYLEASGDYNKLIAGLTGSGIGIQESQKVFSGFAELARVNKLDKTTQNRLFRALSQVAGKGKLMAEELTGQIAEALPGGTALFAQAYQAQTGGKLTGQAAIKKLLEDMKKGKVTSDILTFAGASASAQANRGGALTAAAQASQAEQGRFQSAINDQAVVASNAGVEEGFARIFRTLTAGLNESNGLVERLARGFNEATKWADDLLLWPQSFMRALEGRDSLVADWLGVEATAQMRKDFESIAQSIELISSGEGPEWMVTLADYTKQIAAYVRIIAGIKDFNLEGVGDAAVTAGQGYLNTITMAGRGGANWLLRGIGNVTGMDVPQFTKFGSTEANSYVPESMQNKYGLGGTFGNSDPAAREEALRSMNKSQVPWEQSSPNPFGTSPAALNMRLDININGEESGEGFKAGLEKVIKDYTEMHYVGKLTEALQAYPEK